MSNSAKTELSLAERAMRLSREIRRQSLDLSSSADPIPSELIRLSRELLQKCDELLREMERVRSGIDAA